MTTTQLDDLGKRLAALRATLDRLAKDTARHAAALEAVAKAAKLSTK